MLRERVRVCYLPPFSNTSISEWRVGERPDTRAAGCRHSVTQASASGAAQPAMLGSSYFRHSVTQASASGAGVHAGEQQLLPPPFSNTSISEWREPGAYTLRFMVCRHSVTQASASGAGDGELAGAGLQPPFSNTSISEWRFGFASQLAQQGLHRHSVTQASASGATQRVFQGILTEDRHSVTQASASGAASGRPMPRNGSVRHSVTQASASGARKGDKNKNKLLQPPFSNTSISEWRMVLRRRAGQAEGRHSVTQASASGAAELLEV